MIMNDWQEHGKSLNSEPDTLFLGRSGLEGSVGATLH